MAISAKVEGNKIHITLDMQTPQKSSSGKTTVIASTHGNQAVELDGKTVYIGCNVYTKP